MKAKVLETSATFEFNGEDADSLVLGLSNELSEKTTLMLILLRTISRFHLICSAKMV